LEIKITLPMILKQALALKPNVEILGLSPVHLSEFRGQFGCSSKSLEQKPDFSLPNDKAQPAGVPEAACFLAAVDIPGLVEQLSNRVHRHQKRCRQRPWQ
jgi:hypothetical protein